MLLKILLIPMILLSFFTITYYMDNESMNSMNVNGSSVIEEVIFKETKTKFIAHRGLSGMAPENSIPAFELAGEKGFWGNECDVVETIDNEFVILHDGTLERTTDGIGKVAGRISLEEIKKCNIDFGSNITKYKKLKIPKLEEYLAVCKKFEIVPIIEIKSMNNKSIDILLSKIRRSGLEDKCIIMSFSKDVLKKIREKEADLYIFYLCEFNIKNIFYCKFNKFNMAVREDGVTKELLEFTHFNDLEVNCWTVDDEKRINELIKLGVDYITTNGPINVTN